MKVTVDYPVSGPDHDPALLSRSGLSAVARTADQLGFDALAFTEHPAPSHKWLTSGGHETLDLTSALAFCAAVTEQIRLMTYLLVVPYHNPFAAAKALSTVDLLSDGRLTVVAGTGYLRSEYRNLGVDMELRNERFDEALQVMRGLWSHVPYSFEGRHFAGKDVASLPGPVQTGGPPIVIGGNSALSRRRAVSHDGWSPIMTPPGLAETARTASLTDIPVLAEQIAALRSAATSPRFVQVQTWQTDMLRRDVSDEEHRDHLGRLTEAGVDSFVIQPPCSSVSAAVEGLERYADLLRWP